MGERVNLDTALRVASCRPISSALPGYVESMAAEIKYLRHQLGDGEAQLVPLAMAMQDLLKVGRGHIPESADAFYDGQTGQFTTDRIMSALLNIEGQD